MPTAEIDGSGRDVPTTVILPRRGWFDWRLHQLWTYRDLVALLMWRDFVSEYKQTLLGPAWHLIRPLVTAVVFTAVFSTVAKLPTDGVPPFLFYMCGTVAWTYFASCVFDISKTFVANFNLIGKVYFPRLSIPVSLIGSNLVAFGIQLAIFVVILAAYIASGNPVRPSWWLIAVPGLVLMLAGYAFAIGIILSATTAQYRDLLSLVVFGLQWLMYLTPVIYPVSAIPQRFRWLAAINPLTPIFEAFRRGLLGAGSVSAAGLAASAAVLALLLAAGLVAFTRVEQNVIDTV
ncbi:MAG: ABC transporter permease [Vicinamibacterales bacterium]